MSGERRLAAALLSLLPALIFAGGRALRAARPAPQAQTVPSAASPGAESGQSGYVLKVTTRLVTLDVTATDAHGNPIRDLKPGELQIFEDRKTLQKIEHFEYFEKLASAGDAALTTAGAFGSPGSSGVLSNQLPLAQLKIPPIVLLMDSLNTQTPNQLQGRAHMIQLLKTLPANTPVAVFLLGSSLRILQGFTSDPALLRAALDQSVTGANIVRDPHDDTKSTSSYIQTTTDGSGPNQGLAVQIGEVQNFQNEEYSLTLDLRAKETLGSLQQIGQYLSGIPGRKILIWVSESFPISMAPDPDSGNSPFAGAREYTDQVKAVSNALSDAQVAVYPMDVRGLQTRQSLSASQSISGPQSSLSGPQIAGRLNREDIDLMATQGTMDELAQDTGGKACKNANDLAGCVSTALKDSSSYYELSFYPQNVNWDGRFHKILVKASRPGARLAYRHGYYALDASALAKQQKPEEHLRQACADQLPSTSIPITVRSAPPAASAAPSGAPVAGLQYVLSISAAGLGARQGDGSYHFNARLAECEFARKDTVFRLNERELPKTVSSEVYRTWQASGIPYRVALLPPPDTRRIRFAVLDIASGLTGAIDVPVTPEELAKAAAPVEAPKPVSTTPFAELPDKAKGAAQPRILASLTFHLGETNSGTLDWSGDSLVYRTEGDMPLDKAAGGFSGYAFGGRFHCEGERFVAVDAADGAPALRFTFHNHVGKLVLVDLIGDQPVYTGDLPVDPSAQVFFAQVWKTSHCR